MNLEELAPGRADHLFNFSLIYLRFELVEEKIVNHQARNLGLPVKGAFFQGVDVSDSEDGGEASEAPEDHRAFLNHVSEDESPRVREDNFDVEDDEEHGDDVEFYTEARGALTDRKHSALVWSVLHFRITAFFTEENTEDESNGGEANRRERLEDDGKVVGQHDVELGEG